jgi:hypothetical protein
MGIVDEDFSNKTTPEVSVRKVSVKQHCFSLTQTLDCRRYDKWLYRIIRINNSLFAPCKMACLVRG